MQDKNGDIEFFEELNRQFEEQDRAAQNPEGDEEFFRQIEEQNGVTNPEGDEDFFKQIEEQNEVPNPEGDEDFFKQFEEQNEVPNPEGDEDFFKQFEEQESDAASREERHKAFFEEYDSRESDAASRGANHDAFFEEYDSRESDAANNEEKHKAFFEEYDSSEEKDDEDGGSKSGDPTFFSGISRPLVIEKVKEDGMRLKDVPEKYKDDIEVVFFAVENNGNAFEFASERIQSNKEKVKLFTDAKKLAIEEERLKPNPDPVVIKLLQEQIDLINEIHNKIINKNQKSKYMGVR